MAKHIETQDPHTYKEECSRPKWEEARKKNALLIEE
jgi:hypothetical protein